MYSVFIAPKNQLPSRPRPAPPIEGAAVDDADDTRPRALIVSAAGTQYALSVQQAREVVRAPLVTRVPGAPSVLLGIVNVRGTVVTVLDLAAIVHGGRAVTGASVVLVEDGARLVGFAVDAVHDVRPMEADAAHGAAEGGIVTLNATALCAQYLISAEEMGR